MQTKHLFGLAGIPAGKFYDKVHSRLVMGRVGFEYFGFPLTKGYSEGYAYNFVRHFAKLIEQDQHNELTDTCFGIIAVGAGLNESFLRPLFPSVLVSTVNWHPEFDWQNGVASGTAVNVSANRLVQLIESEASRLAAAQKGMCKELIERSNRTPLLLPAKNFKSDLLAPLFLEVQGHLQRERTTSDHVRRSADAFTTVHQHSSEGEAAFLDNREVVYKAPGKLRHGFARGRAGGHTDKCIIAARYRLGSPYDPAFHWDCTRKHKPEKNLKGDFDGCHTPPESKEGDPHINIAPNDFVRV